VARSNPSTGRRDRLTPARTETPVTTTYWGSLCQVVLSPGAFFERSFNDRFPMGTGRFIRLNGLLIVLGFFLLEVLTGGRIGWPFLMAAAISLVVLPFLLQLLTVFWAAFAVLASRLLGEPLETGKVRDVWAFSTVGLLPLAFGGGWLSLLALWTVGLQTLGLEKAFACSRFKAAVLAGFPFLLLVTLGFMVAIIFKTRVF
jgi:hypothetical protein